MNERNCNKKVRGFSRTVSRPEIGNKHNILEAGRTGLTTLAPCYSVICLRTTEYEHKATSLDIHSIETRVGPDSVR